MRLMLDFWSRVLRNADGGSGGGPGAAGGGGDGAGTLSSSSAAKPESILFPGEAKPADPAGGASGDDWKEYVPDPNKSDADNAAAKAEHDKTKPAEKKPEDQADRVPADGKYTLTMPDGVEVDQELLDAIGPDFKDIGLTNAQAQRLADRFIQVQQDRATKQVEGWGKTVQKWADDAKADADIGGDKWDATVTASRRAVSKLGTPALREYLEASGGGNHPELIRFMAKVGAMISDDNPPSGKDAGAGRPVEAAHVLFPNDVPKG